MDLTHVLSIIVLTLEGVCALMGIVYYALKLSEYHREARKKQAE